MDPLGALRASTAIATTLLPGVTTITTRARYLSWVCAGLRLLDAVPDAPTGGRSGRARRQRLLSWERLVALATGTYAVAAGASEDDPAWRQLRGVSYVRRAVGDGVRSPDFPMLRNQAGIGGVGTYWVTLVAGGLVEPDSGELTPRGNQLADTFLDLPATPDRNRLLRVLRDESTSFPEAALDAWGRAAHLGAATTRERRLLADALLEPAVHRRMAEAMGSVDAAASDRPTFRRLLEHLKKQDDPLSGRLAAVLAIAPAFEHLHRELLYRFDQVRAMGFRRPVPIMKIELTGGSASLTKLGSALAAALDTHAPKLPPSVADALRGFQVAVQPAVRAATDAELVRTLIGYHERVQAGKLDASRQPKLPWVELRGDGVHISPRFALDNPPKPPPGNSFTHPYRIVQFRHLLEEAGVWTAAP